MSAFDRRALRRAERIAQKKYGKSYEELEEEDKGLAYDVWQEAREEQTDQDAGAAEAAADAAREQRLMERKEEAMNDYTGRSGEFYEELNALTRDIEKLRRDLARSYGEEPTVGELQDREEQWSDRIQSNSQLAPIEAEKLKKYVTQGFGNLRATRPRAESIGEKKLKELQTNIVPPESETTEIPLEEAIFTWKSLSDQIKLLESQIEDVKGKRATLMEYIAPQMEALTNSTLETDNYVFTFKQYSRKVSPGYKELFAIALTHLSEEVRNTIEKIKEELSTVDVRRTIQILEKPQSKEEAQDEENIFVRLAAYMRGTLNHLVGVLQVGAEELGDITQRAIHEIKSENKKQKQKPSMRKTTIPTPTEIGTLSWDDMHRLVKQGKFTRREVLKTNKETKHEMSDTVLKMCGNDHGYQVYDRHGELVTSVEGESDAKARAHSLGGFYESAIKEEKDISDDKKKEAIQPVLRIRGYSLIEIPNEEQPHRLRFRVKPGEARARSQRRAIDFYVEKLDDGRYQVLDAEGQVLGTFTSLMKALHTMVPVEQTFVPPAPEDGEGHESEEVPLNEKEDNEDLSTEDIYRKYAAEARQYFQRLNIVPVEEDILDYVVESVAEESGQIHVPEEQVKRIQHILFGGEKKKEKRPFDDISNKIGKLATDLKLQDVQQGPAGAVSARLETPGQVGLIEAELNKYGLMNDVGVIIEQGRINIYPLMLEKSKIMKDTKDAVAKIDEAMSVLKKVWNQLSEDEKVVYDWLAQEKELLLELLKKEATFPSAGQYNPSKEPLRGLL